MARILIVEDDIFMSNMYERLLRFEGFEVNVAKDGVEGLDKISSFAPDLILLDIMMPRKNGIEVLQEVKGNKETASIPVVILTNLANPRESEIAYSLGAVKYIVKSEYEPKQVVNMVKDILAKNSPPPTLQNTSV